MKSIHCSVCNFNVYVYCMHLPGGIIKEINNISSCVSLGETFPTVMVGLFTCIDTKIVVARHQKQWRKSAIIYPLAS